MSVFLYHTIDLSLNHHMEVTSSGPSPLCSWFIYDPHRRYEVIFFREIAQLWDFLRETDILFFNMDKSGDKSNPEKK